MSGAPKDVSLFHLSSKIRAIISLYFDLPDRTLLCNVFQVLLVSLVALAAAAPQQQQYYQKPPIKLISQYFNQDGKGNYEYGYEQDNGQKVRDKVLTSWGGCAEFFVWRVYTR